MNNYTKYGLIFLGGVALGALGAMAISRWQLISWRAASLCATS